MYNVFLPRYTHKLIKLYNEGHWILQDADASARKAEAARKRAEDIAAGTVQMNGRELFLHDPSVFDNSQY